MSEQRKLVTFYTLLLTQTFSLIGSRMTALALGIWVFNETGNATPLTLIAFFGFLPRLLSASLAGVLADRWDRRYVMAIADVGQAVGTVILLVTFAAGALELWLLYLVTVIQATFDIFQAPAFQASVTMLIPDKHRNRANAIQLVTSPLAGILAPSLAAIAYALVDVSGIIAFDLFTFAVSMLVVMSVNIPRPPQSAESHAVRGSIWREALAGFQFVWQRPPLLMVFVFTGMTNFFLASMITLNTPYILKRTASEATLGTLLSVYSLGSLAGTMLMATWGGTGRRTDTMMPGLATAGIAWAIYSTQTHFILMAIPLFIAAMFPPMNNVSIISVLQIKVPPDLQGRVFAAISQLSMTLIPLSYLVAGPLADRVFEPFGERQGWEAGAGMSLMFLIGGLAMAMIGMGIYAIPWVRNLETILPDYQAGQPTTPPAPETVPDTSGAQPV